MPTMTERISDRVGESLAPVHFELVDESHMHGGRGQDTHFNMVVVSDTFTGLVPVRRHRLVYQALEAEFDDGLHALTLRTLSPSEWQAAQGTLAAKSPQCRGGSKAG